MNSSYMAQMEKENDFDIFEANQDLFQKLFDDSNLFLILGPSYNLKLQTTEADGWLIPRNERQLFFKVLKTNDELLKFKKVVISDFLLLDKGHLIDENGVQIAFDEWSTQMNWFTNERSMDRQFCLVPEDWHSEIEKIKSEDDEALQLEEELKGYKIRMKEIKEKLARKKTENESAKQIQKWTHLEDKKNAEKDAQNALVASQDEATAENESLTEEIEIDQAVMIDNEGEMTEVITQDAITEDGQKLQITYNLK